MSGIFGIREKVSNKVVDINVEKIIPNPHQPRSSFSKNELEFLAESIRQDGIIQPLTVRREGSKYELISGERRLRASKIVGLKTVPCIIIDVTERNSAVLALVENIQRQDLSYFDEAYAISQLIDFYGMTQEDAAIRLGKAQSTIANKLRLLKLSEREMELLKHNNLTERHARALLKLSDHEQREFVIGKVVKNNYNVEKTEEFIEQLINAEKEHESLKRRSGAFKDVRLFVNTINKAIETMRAAGINADSKKKEVDGFIEYVVRIPVEQNKLNA